MKPAFLSNELTGEQLDLALLLFKSPSKRLNLFRVAEILMHGRQHFKQPAPSRRCFTSQFEMLPRLVQ